MSSRAPKEVPEVPNDGEVRRVPLRDIRLDSVYQRDLDNNRVQRMVREWDPRQASSITISARASLLFCVDGQHRLAAARERGELYIWAKVLTGLSQADEADLFVRLQRGRKNLNAWDLFKAETVAGHEGVLNITRIVHNAGFKIDRTSGHTHIQAVGALRRIYALGAEPLLTLVLATVRQCWSGDQLALGGQPMEGLGLFYHSFRGEPQYDGEHALRLLARTPAVTFVRLAQEIAANRSSTSSSAANVAEAIRNQYNQKLPPAKKLGSIKRIRRSPGR